MFQNEYVWLKPRKGALQVPIGARILGIFNTRIKVQDDDNKEYFISSEEILKPMHPTSILSVDDMTALGELQEYSILRNLLIRYKKDCIYTYIGSVLVAVNPHKDLPIYSSQDMMKYRKKRLKELPPHIFAIADNTYEIMRVNSEKLCIIISGESGTGKTVSTRLLLQYYARMVNRKKSGKQNQILNSNPVLEAFGNAKTVSNDNSSRFGKYVVVNFSREGNIESAEIKHYLLEKSRIICRNEGEQNYHIFYSILKGMPELEKQQLHLTTPSSYYYLNTAEDASTTYYKEYSKIRAALQVFNFTDADIWNVFKTLAVILHLGNIQYEAVSQSNIESVIIGRKREIEIICELLQVDKEHLIQCLTKKTIATHGDEIITPLSKKQATDYRDAFSKRIYENLFNFIVEKINAVLVDEEKKAEGYIGILDIFGFETLEKNSFEQLCINYANERLHKFFTKHIFKMEQDIYMEEGINWKYLSYPDNDDILELIETGPKSILSTINDESKLPQSTDQSLLNKLIEFHSENNNFFKPKFNFAAVFGIHHFAGVVLYDVKDFLEKNHDTFNHDIKQVVESSGNPFLQKIFAGDLQTDYRGVYKNKKESLIDRFKSSLNSLILELSQCQSHFIRCIRPNEYKKPQIFNRTLCWKQLRYSGMLETTKIRESGYPVRYDYVRFIQKFGILHPEKPLAYKINCKNATLKICNLVLNMQQKANVRLGNTHIFLKPSEELILEKRRNDALQKHVIIIQKTVRGWIARQRYFKLKKAVRLLETSWLRKRKKRETIKLIPMSELKRSDSKSKISMKKMLDKNFITRFQARCRGYLVRQIVRNSAKKFGRKNSMNSSLTFAQYVEKYFQKKQNYEFNKKPLKTPLHDNLRGVDAVAAKALWSTILRYTENISEPKKTVPSLLPLIRDILWRMHAFEKTSKEKIAEIDGLYKKWLTTHSNKYQKLEFIIGHGITRPELRDEIYCQICKVITKNPSEIAKGHAWNLLSSCCSTFPPSSIFLNYLKAFVKEEKNKFTSYCLYHLRKVVEKGCRNQSPWYTELEAIKQLKPVEVAVILMNGKTINIKIDSLTTGKEMLGIVAKNICLRDSFGFCLLLEQDKKLFSLGSSSNYVLDVVAQREKYAWEISNSFNANPWKIFLKKEIFAPWHDSSVDEVATALICSQIQKGIKSGEYECEVEDLYRILAKICFCVYGKIQQPVFHEIIDNCIPRHVYILLNDDEISFFKDEVETFYFKVECHKPIDTVRAELLQFAMKKWPFHFSKLFSVTGTISNTSSLICSENLLNILLNSYGLQFMSENDAKNIPILKMDFAEIKDITIKKLEDQGYFLKITSYLGIETTLIFPTQRDTDLYDLLTEIMDSLREYSKYVIARKENICQENSFMELKEGDLIILTSKFYGRDLIRNSWAEGQNVRTKETGKFLINNVEIIPTIESPNQALLQALREAKANVRMNETEKKPERFKHYTLETYADKFFAKKKDKTTELWKHSRRKIEHPLHSNLTSPIHFAESIQVFEAILTYMEDASKKELNDAEVIQKIFYPGLKHDELRDEIYCQIMKQLTSNQNRESNNRGWELMWIATGLFGCSKNLTKEVQKFLMTRRVKRMPRICLARFYKAMNSSTRKFTCHPIEIKAMRQEPCEILYRIYFPDYSDKFFQINSLMTVEQLKNLISKRLGILQSNGFELFAQVQERLFLIPSDYFIFDYFKQLDDWILKSNINSSKGQYFLFFMLHSWKNIVPGRDETIDTKFLFPQEYNKYIKGCYKVPDKDMINLAAFLHNIFSSKKENEQYLQILPRLLPENIINKRKQHSWEKDIQLNLPRKQTLSETESKIQFLQYLFKLPSYGMTYFPVKYMKSAAPNHILYPINLTAKSGF